MSARRDAALYDLERLGQVDHAEWEFVQRLQANDDAAYDELVRTFNGPVFHVAFRMLGDPAETADVVQDIFVKVFRSIGKFKGECSLRTWIYKVAFSEILNRLRWWRRRHKHSTLSLDDNSAGTDQERGYGLQVPDSRPTPEEILASREEEIAIQQALERLSSDHRSIVILRDIEGFAYNEIADILGVSVGTVKSRLARARADLKQVLMRFLSVQHL